MTRIHPLCLPAILLVMGVLAGRFIWPRQRGLTADEKARVNVAWSAAARETGLAEKNLTKRPRHPALAGSWDFLQLLEKTPVAGFPALWASLPDWKKTPGTVWRDSVEQQLLIERWAELDPEGAYAFLTKETASQQLVALVFRVWARTNGETALAAIAAEADGKVRDAAVIGVFSAVSEEPADLIAWARRLSWLDTSKVREEQLDNVIPPEALRRAFESDPAACLELARGQPAWFRHRLEALAAVREAATDLPAALARIDAAGLDKKSAPAFFQSMAPLAESDPDKLLAVLEHLTDKLGNGWLKLSYGNATPILTAMAQVASGRIHAILNRAAPGDFPAYYEAAVDLVATDPRLALEIAPAGNPWTSEFFGGRMLSADVAGSPQETLELVRTAPSSTLRDGLLHDALTAMLKSSPEAAAAWVDSLPPGELQNAARVTLERPDLPPLRAELERTAASAAEGDPRGADIYRLRSVTGRAAHVDAAGTAQQVAAWPASDARSNALVEVGRSWGGTATSEALAWAEGLEPGAREHALAGIMEPWTQHEPAAASEYVAALPPGNARDVTVRAFARSLSGLDPEAALRWAATVQSAGLRNTVLDDVAGAWMKSDPESAREGLESIPGLTPAERARLAGPKSSQ